MKPSFIIGIDGGGSKTRALLYNCIDMRPENFVEVDSSTNYHVVGFSNASNVLRKIISRLVKNRKDIPIVVGLAGLDSQYDWKKWSKYLNRMYKEIFLLHDVHISLFTASYGEPGIIVISGTGFNVYGWDGKKEWYAGNWGWKVGDEASGYHVGKESLRHILRYLDGRSEKCLFYDDVMKYLKLSSMDELINWIYNAKPSYIASLSEIVCKHYQHSNIAKKIIDDAVEEAFLSVKTVASKLTREFPVNYTGGMFNCIHYKNLFLRYLEESGYSIGDYVKHPIIGTIIYGLKKLDIAANFSYIRKSISSFLEEE